MIDPSYVFSNVSEIDRYPIDPNDIGGLREGEGDTSPSPQQEPNNTVI